MALTALQERAFALELRSTEFPSNPSKKQIGALDHLFENVYTGLLPRAEDYHARKTAVDFVNGLARDKLSVADVKKHHGVCNARAFGSFTMDMFTSTSDLDISLNVGYDSEGLTREDGVNLLKKLTKLLYKLQSNGVVRDIQPVLRAKVPVVKFIHRNTGIECDVSVENRDGIFKSELLRIFSSIDSRFRKLCFLLKAWANAHGINSSKDHTLNSLSIILLAALHLQTRVPAILPPFSKLLKGLNGSIGSHATSFVEQQVNAYKDFGKRNGESVFELFNSFLTKIMAVKDLWQEGLCASAYEGTWTLATTPNWIFVEDFTSLSQNAARSVNGNGFEAIYECCNQTVTYLKDYFLGVHEARSLKTLLFDLHITSAIHKRKRKRDFQQAKADIDQPIEGSIGNPFSRSHDRKSDHIPLYKPAHVLGRDYFARMGYSMQNSPLPTANTGLMRAKRLNVQHDQYGDDFMSPFTGRQPLPDKFVNLHSQGYPERHWRESQQFNIYTQRKPQFSEPRSYVLPFPPTLDIYEQRHVLGERSAGLAYRRAVFLPQPPPPPLPLVSTMRVSLHGETLRGFNLGAPSNTVPSYGYGSRSSDRL